MRYIDLMGGTKPHLLIKSVNNLGAEALLQRDLAAAYGQMARAIEVAPRRADPWINLGVVLGRNAQYAEAETAYLAALARDPGAIPQPGIAILRKSWRGDVCATGGLSGGDNCHTAIM